MSDLLLLRVLEHIHGHVGCLSVAALLHPAILLRNPKRRAPLAVALTTLFVIVTALLGAFIYPEYRDRIKQHIFIEAPRVGWLFERKEHLAVGAVAFALAGCLSHFSVPVFEGDTRLTMARLAHRSFVVSFLLGSLVVLLGISVASFKTF